MEDILRDHRQLNIPARRYMKRIDLVLSARMLRLPHPLLADNIDVHRIGRRVVDSEVQQRSPDKHDQKERQRNDGPGRLEQSRTFYLNRNRMPLLPIADRETKDEDSNKRQADQCNQH